MEINEITRQKIADKLVAAITDEKLLNKNVAVKFETDSATMSHLKRPENFNRISPRVWENFRQWYYSGEKLSTFVLAIEPEKVAGQTPEPAAAEIPATKTEGSKFQDISSAPFPEKNNIAAKMRKKFEDGKKQDEKATVKKFKAEARAAARRLREEYEAAQNGSVSLPDGKTIDLLKINPLTGVTIEYCPDQTIITIKHPVQ